MVHLLLSCYQIVFLGTLSFSMSHIEQPYIYVAYYVAVLVISKQIEWIFKVFSFVMRGPVISLKIA